MTVDFKKLKNFVKIVDTESVSRAADQLHIAQPALSLQVTSLEDDFKQKLLIRTNHGVTATEAGRALYRHARLLLKQLEQAHIDVNRTASIIAGNVSVGLATYSTTSLLSIPLLKAVTLQYPEITLCINDNFGIILSEMIMTGRMDMAIIYGSGPMRGVSLQPLFSEELYLIAPRNTKLLHGTAETIPLAALEGMKLLLPGKVHFLRKVIDAAFVRAQITPCVIAEIESAVTLRAAIDAELGATILPWSVASALTGAEPPLIRRIISPTIRVPVSLCVSDHLPMSDPAIAVREILNELLRELACSGRCFDIQELAPLPPSIID